MGKITIVGLGAGDLEQLPLGIYRLLLNSKHIYLRTSEHPVVASLEEEGFEYESFDAIYEKHETFEAVYEEITETLFELAKDQDIIYALPGHPFVAEKTVQLLVERSKEKRIEVESKGGQSFLDAIFNSVKIDPIEGFTLLDGTLLKKEELNLKQHQFIGQVYDQYVASDVKLTLMELLPYDYEVAIVTAAGSKGEVIKYVPLVELDREVELNNLTSLYVPPVKEENDLNKTFPRFREIISILRGPNGCPWDKEQTHESLKTYVLEEAYELIEAIEEDDIDGIIEELGDLLLQIVLHAQIGQEEGFFTLEDVIESISEKMIRRHPHVFNTNKKISVDEVVENWDEIKKKEKQGKRELLLSGVPKTYPSLKRAQEYQQKAAAVGFEFENVADAWSKFEEELKEFKVEEKDQTVHMEEEFGDVLFSIINIARFYQIDGELALQKANNKFYKRFNYIEEQVKEKQWKDLSLEELDKLWNDAKSKGL